MRVVKFSPFLVAIRNPLVYSGPNPSCRCSVAQVRLGPNLKDRPGPVVMSARLQLRWAHVWVGASLLLTWLIHAPAPVHASCGDYLQHLTPNVANHTMSGPLQHHALPQHGHAPCTGPFCSGEKQPLPITPAAPVSMDREHAVVITELFTAGAGLTWPVLCPPPARASQRAAPIYHPPRLPSVRFCLIGQSISNACCF